MAANTQPKSNERVGDFNDEHPLHPALVHFPIALNILAWALDILYGFTAIWWKPNFLTSRLGDDNTLLDISRLSYFLLCTGLLSTVLAIVTGGTQLMEMINKNGGLWEKDAKSRQTDTMLPKIRVAVAHALMNDVVFAVGIYNWYLRRGTTAHPNVGNLPNSLNVVLSAVLLPSLIVASRTGAHLVYNHGVGLKLGRKKLD